MGKKEFLFLLFLRVERQTIAFFWFMNCSLSTKVSINEPVVWRPDKIPLTLL